MSRVFLDYDLVCVCDIRRRGKKICVCYIRQFNSFTYAHVNSVDDGEISYDSLSLLQENRTQSVNESEKIRNFGISKNRNRNEMEAVCQFNSLGLSPSIRGTNA